MKCAVTTKTGFFMNYILPKRCVLSAEALLVADMSNQRPKFVLDRNRDEA
jgi:hypothetical protein